MLSWSDQQPHVLDFYHILTVLYDELAFLLCRCPVAVRRGKVLVPTAQLNDMDPSTTQ